MMEMRKNFDVLRQVIEITDVDFMCIAKLGL